MHKALENMPVVWGGMDTFYLKVPAGWDVAPQLNGLPDDKCPCPHWGYVFKGSIYVRYSDGVEEKITAGETYYMPPGHTVWTDEDTTFLLISPEKEHNEVNRHMQKKRDQLAQKSG